MGYLNAVQDHADSVRPRTGPTLRVFHRGNFSRDQTLGDYAGTDWQGDIPRALMEGFAWLEREGLLVPAPHHDPDWLVLSRQAREIRSPDHVERLLRSRSLRTESLHPALAQKCGASFLDVEYDTAVFRAFREVEIALREAGGFGPEVLGKALAMAAFHKDGGPLWNRKALDSENEGLRFLFAGAAMTFKNATSHREVEFDSPVEAAEVIGFASLLLRMIDRLRPG